jgi:hypothetical protein
VGRLITNGVAPVGPVVARVTTVLRCGYCGVPVGAAVPMLIGTSGWQYKHWRGGLYPEGLAVPRWLGHYAERSNLGLDLGALDLALRCLPKTVRVAVEFRHASWWTPAARSLLEGHGASLCLADLGGTRSPLWRTAGGATCACTGAGPSHRRATDERPCPAGRTTWPRCGPGRRTCTSTSTTTSTVAPPTTPAGSPPPRPGPAWPPAGSRPPGRCPSASGS